MALVKLCIILSALFFLQVPAFSIASSVTTFFPLNNGDIKYFEFTYGSARRDFYLRYTAETRRDGAFLETDNSDKSQVLYDNRSGLLSMPGVIIDGEYLWFKKPLGIFSDEIIENGGKYSSAINTSYEGTSIYITVDTFIDKVINVKVPVGEFNNCRIVSFDMVVHVDGISMPIIMKNVWTLAPQVGKIQVEVVDENNNFIDTAELTSGSVAGVEISAPPKSIQLAPILRLLLNSLAEIDP